MHVYPVKVAKPRPSVAACWVLQLLREPDPALYGRPAAMNSAALGHIRCSAHSQQFGRRA